jgi:hypothetical protein
MKLLRCGKLPRAAVDLKARLHLQLCRQALQSGRGSARTQARQSMTGRNMSGDDGMAAKGDGVSRRRMLRGGLLAAGGAAALSPASAAAPAAAASTGRRNPAPEGGPAADRSIRIEKNFRALVRRASDAPAKVETVKLLPFGGR